MSNSPVLEKGSGNGAIAKPSTTNKGYKAPKHGIFSLLPAAVVPYAELMRLDRPSGYWVSTFSYVNSSEL
jgi:hypothetical protein